MATWTHTVRNGRNKLKYIVEASRDAFDPRMFRCKGRIPRNCSHILPHIYGSKNWRPYEANYSKCCSMRAWGGCRIQCCPFQLTSASGPTMRPSTFREMYVHLGFKNPLCTLFGAQLQHKPLKRPLYPNVSEVAGATAATAVSHGIHWPS